MSFPGKSPNFDNYNYREIINDNLNNIVEFNINVKAGSAPWYQDSPNNKYKINAYKNPAYRFLYRNRNVQCPRIRYDRVNQSPGESNSGPNVSLYSTYRKNDGTYPGCQQPGSSLIKATDIELYCIEQYISVQFSDHGYWLAFYGISLAQDRSVYFQYNSNIGDVFYNKNICIYYNQNVPRANQIYQWYIRFYPRLDTQSSCVETGKMNFNVIKGKYISVNKLKIDDINVELLKNNIQDTIYFFINPNNSNPILFQDIDNSYFVLDKDYINKDNDDNFVVQFYIDNGDERTVVYKYLIETYRKIEGYKIDNDGYYYKSNGYNYECASFNNMNCIDSKNKNNFIIKEGKKLNNILSLIVLRFDVIFFK